MCAAPNCDEKILAKGLCRTHYQRLRRHGDLNTNKKPWVSGKKKHGFHNSPTYKSWNMMKQRCNNPNNTNYKDYGGRGITVCESWQDSFESFLKDMGERPNGTSIDRIDNDLGYYPENCRWATQQTQTVNSRLQSNNTTGFKGVYKRKDTGRWQVEVTRNGKKKSYGCYDTANEANKVRERVLANG